MRSRKAGGTRIFRRIGLGLAAIPLLYLLAALVGYLVAVRLRPDEYRKLWAAVRASFALELRGRPKRVAHPGYWTDDAFYEGVGTANALATCNQWVADRLRLAGVRTSLWSPFAQGL